MSDRDFVPVLIPRPGRAPAQPPEVDGDDDRSLPDLIKAADRIREFVSQWGDGRIDTAGDAHLFARDLEVVARYAQEAETDGE